MGAAKAAEEAENIIYVVDDGLVCSKDIEGNLKTYGKKKRKRMVIGLVKG